MLEELNQSYRDKLATRTFADASKSFVCCFCVVKQLLAYVKARRTPGTRSTQLPLYNMGNNSRQINVCRNTV